MINKKGSCILKKLDGLAKLQSEGLISGEEFEEIKAEILDKKD